MKVGTLMKKTLKAKNEPQQTDIIPKIITSDEMTELNQKEMAENVKTGHFDFKTGKVILD